MWQAVILRAPLVLLFAKTWHLPHLGGDRPSPLLSPISNIARRGANSEAANLPPSGGDVRQDRGGREGTQHLSYCLPCIKPR